MKLFIGLFIGLLLISGISNFFSSQSSDSQMVGVARSKLSLKLDLTDKLNPEILPDVLNQVFSKMDVSQKPEAEKFQKELIRKFSQAIMDDPEVNYRVDLNEDGVIDPVLVVPENIENQGAVYSIRVPDPSDYPKDPESGADWDKIAKKQSIELVEVSTTFDRETKALSISSTPNGQLYENSQGSHYSNTYRSQSHGYLNGFMTGYIFSSILFRPYGWGYGGFYGGYYGSYYRPHPTSYRSRSVRSSRYGKAPRSTSALKSSKGTRLTGSRNGNKSPSKSIQKLKSNRAMKVRQQRASSRQGGFGRSKTRGVKNSRSGGFGRQRSSSFGGGGSRGWGK